MWKPRWARRDLRTADDGQREAIHPLFEKYANYDEKATAELLAILDARLPGSASEDEGKAG